jgi:hypothetical protein
MKATTASTKLRRSAERESPATDLAAIGVVEALGREFWDSEDADVPGRCMRTGTLARFAAG